MQQHEGAKHRPTVRAAQLRIEEGVMVGMPGAARLHLMQQPVAQQQQIAEAVGDVDGRLPAITNRDVVDTIDRVAAVRVLRPRVEYQSLARGREEDCAGQVWRPDLVVTRVFWHLRSEERRVGKEGRSWRLPELDRKE